MDTRLLAQMLRGKLEKSPLLHAEQRLEPLAAIAAPSLEGLSARVTLPPVPTEDSLFVPRWRLMRAFGDVTARARGETVQAGDEVLVDLVGYVNGAIMPFSAAREVWLDPETDGALPGMRDALCGARVGGRAEVAVRYPTDHPDGLLGGKTITYAVFVRAAQGVKPASLSDPRVLAALEVKSAEQLEEVLAAWVVDAYEARCHELIRSAALAAFAERVVAAVPDDVISADIRRRWDADEGAILKTQGVAPRMQEQALESWLGNADLRDEIAAGYRIALGLSALLASGAVTVTHEDGLRFLAAWAADEGVDADELVASLSEAPEADLAALDEVIARTKAIEHVLAHVEIEALTDAAR